jgi:glycosyltransferase involved in cell wall biosynthesis
MYRIFYLLCLICVFQTGYGDDKKNEKQKICLNMIVKDESKVITRGLASVKPIIDYWVIVDTGSTDGTQQVIKDFMKDVPGELHERPWKNFGHNRQEALELAKGKADYVLLLDADELLEYAPDFKMPILDMDSYNNIIRLNQLQYDRTLLIKDKLDWKWHGVLHEYLESPQAKTTGKLDGIVKVSKRDGARSVDPKKYLKDAQTIETALKDDPNNSRYVFYLAQSYRDAGDNAAALKNYERRVKMGGWEEEVFYAMLQAARMQELLNYPAEVVLKSYFDAYHFRPKRAEPIYYLAKYYRDKNDFASAYLMTTIGVSIPMPQDMLFVEKWIYDYDMLLEASISSYWVGKYDDSQRFSKLLLSKKDLSDDLKQLVEQNLTFANAKIAERYQSQAVKFQIKPEDIKSVNLKAADLKTAEIK